MYQYNICQTKKIQNVSLLMISKDATQLQKCMPIFYQKKKNRNAWIFEKSLYKGSPLESHFTQSSNSHQLE